MGVIEITNVECSSEEEEFPASNLRTFDEEGEGWLSSPDVSAYSFPAVSCDSHNLICFRTSARRGDSLST